MCAPFVFWPNTYMVERQRVYSNVSATDTWTLFNFVRGFFVSPEPAGDQLRSPLSCLARCGLCPDRLGYEEPDWRQSLPWAEPEESRLPLCPWPRAAEEVRWWRWPRQRKEEGGCPADFKDLVPGEQKYELSWCSVRTNFSAGNILAGSYIHLTVTGSKPQRELEKETGRKNQPIIRDLIESI